MKTLDRAKLAWARFWGWVCRLWETFWAWVRKPFRLAHEAAIEGRTALFAVAQDTPEGDIQAATQRSAWTTQIARLEAIDNRSLSQNLLLAQLWRDVRNVDRATARRHATPQTLGARRLADFGAVGAVNPIMGILLSPTTWMVAGLVGLLGLNGFTGWRLDHAKHDLTEARADLRSTEEALETARTVNERLVHDIRAADLQTRTTAANLEAERARHARAAANERRRQHEIENVRLGRDPPAWSLRDDGSGPPAPSDDSSAAPGNPG